MQPFRIGLSLSERAYNYLSRLIEIALLEVYLYELYQLNGLGYHYTLPSAQSLLGNIVPVTRHGFSCWVLLESENIKPTAKK